MDNQSSVFFVNNPRLNEKFNNLTQNISYEANFAPYIFPISKNLYEESIMISECLNFGFRKIIYNWLISTTSKESVVLSLPHKIEIFLREQAQQILDNINKENFVGFLRPDFLLNQHGQIMICEVNCRFCLNGYFLSQEMQKLVREGVFNVNENFFPIDSTLTFSEHFKKKILSYINFNKDKSIYSDSIICIYGRELPHDIQFVSKVFDHVCEVKYIHYDNLILRDSVLCYKTNNDNNSSKCCSFLISQFAEIKFCILELHQDELFDLSENILKSLLQLSIEGRCINPIWTIFLCHDKRCLHLLRNIYSTNEEEKVMINELQQHIIPTSILSIEIKDESAILNKSIIVNSLNLSPNGILIKPSLDGKGNAIVFLNKEEDISNLEKNIQDYLKEKNYLNLNKFCNFDFVIQPFIEQRKLNLNELFEKLNLPLQGNYYVLTNLIMDNKYFGPGCIRASPSRINTLSKNSFIIFPAFYLKNISSSIHNVNYDLLALYTPLNHIENNENIITETKKFTFGKIRDFIMQDLLSNGFSFCIFNNQDFQLTPLILETLFSIYFQASILSYNNSKIWEIKPNKFGIARSHTFQEFDIHTDASFLEIPPRFVSLAIRCSDTYGGGFSGIAEIRKAVNILNIDDYKILRSTSVKWKIPEEFIIDQKDCIFAPVLLSRSRGRLRKDIILTDHLPEDLRKKFWNSFNKLYNILKLEACKNMFIIPQNTLFTLDNHRFVHFRTEVKDPNRFLYRIQFDLPYPPEILNYWIINNYTEKVTSKIDFIQNIQSKFHSNYYNKGSLYWTSSSGTSSYGTSTKVERCIPVSNEENSLLRMELAEIMNFFGAINSSSVVVNLMESSGMYRSLDAFNNFCELNNASLFPLGTLMRDEEVLQFCLKFGINTIIGWPSRLLQLGYYAKKNSKISYLSTIHTIIYGGEEFSIDGKLFFASLCNPNCKFFAIYGSSETGIFACSKSLRYDEEVIYYASKESIYLEVVDIDGENNYISKNLDEEGNLVVTNLFRKSINPVNRFNTGDIGKIISNSNQGVSNGLWSFKVQGRNMNSLSIHLNNKTIFWNSIKSITLSCFKDFKSKTNIHSNINDENSYTKQNLINKHQDFDIIFQFWVHENDNGDKTSTVCTLVLFTTDINSISYKIIEQLNLEFMKYLEIDENSYNLHFTLKLVDNFNLLKRSPLSNKLLLFVDERKC